MKLIINADDFGISLGTNYGIVEAYKNGCVSSTTMMMNQSGTEEAMKLLKENRGLGVGIHFVLSKGEPLVKGHKSIVNEDGIFIKDYKKLMVADEDEIEREFRAQFERFLSFGEKPTHIDSHHHVHAVPPVKRVVEKLAREHDLPVRTVSQNMKLYDSFLEKDIKTNDGFVGSFFGDNMTVEKLIEYIESEYKAGREVVEVMCHPSFIDPEIFYGSSYNTARINEYKILTSEKLKNYIKDNNIELVTFREL